MFIYMPVKKTSRSTSSAAWAKKVEKKTTAKRPATKKATTVKKETAKKTVTKKPAVKKTTTKKVATKKTTKSTWTAVVAKKRTKPLSTDITTGTHLIIVESPAKARTISGFLWKNVDVQASFGHVSDLPNKTLWVDIKNQFTPTYEIPSEKKKVIANLKKAANWADGVWIATDEDREGEAIWWHVANALGLDIAKTPRIVFHEITKQAIQEAIEKPRVIDMDLVDAQQARRVLDRVVWFSVSPILWTKVRRWLSAGRVQSVAVKLIIEREKEIQDFKPQESWKLFADLSHKEYSLTVELAKVAGKNPQLKNYADVQNVLSDYDISLNDKNISVDKKTENKLLDIDYKHSFVLKNTVVKEGKKHPSAPFTTSSLQQEASRRFWWSVKQVMSVAQRLYEAGHITYMRTDSTNLSSLALWAAKKYIVGEFGEKYHQVRQYATKSKGAQEAHEAIRPTYIDRAPEKAWLSWQEASLYRLIWLRTVASQMASALFEETTYEFVPENIDHIWTIKGEIITFPWFLSLYGKPDPKKTQESDEEKNDEDLEEVVLPKIAEKTVCESTQFHGKQQFSQPPSRYTESALVKALESRGIWRPSTYAPTIATIQDRGYVEKKQDKKLYPTEIAFLVNDYLEKFFTKLMDYAFTADMEGKLDDIALWKIQWEKMMMQFYEGFEPQLQEAKKGEKAVMPVWRSCPQCKEGNLIYKFTKFGKFIWCDRYPECDYTEKTQEEKDALAPLREKYEWQPCPEWWTIVVKMWRFWPFLTSSLYPQVKWISSIPDETKIALEKEHGGGECSECWKWKMVVKKARRGNYFLACSRYPDCKNAQPIPGQEPEKWASKYRERRFTKKTTTKKTTK